MITNFNSFCCNHLHLFITPWYSFGYVRYCFIAPFSGEFRQPVPVIVHNGTCTATHNSCPVSLVYYRKFRRNAVAAQRLCRPHNSSVTVKSRALIRSQRILLYFRQIANGCVVTLMIINKIKRFVIRGNQIYKENTV